LNSVKFKKFNKRIIWKDITYPLELKTNLLCNWKTAYNLLVAHFSDHGIIADEDDLKFRSQIW